MIKADHRIRKAEFRDIPALLTLGEEVFNQSPWSNGFILDKDQFKKVAIEVIGHQIADKPPSMIFLSESEEGIEAMMVGFVRPLYECLTLNVASNMIWYSSPSANGRAATNVLRAFMEWADNTHGPVLHRYCITGSVVNHHAVGALLTRFLGFTEAGGIYEKGPMT